MAQAEAAGELRSGTKPRRLAALTMETVMFIAQSSGVSEDEDAHPLSADEVWDFCARGFAGARRGCVIPAAGGLAPPMRGRCPALALQALQLRTRRSRC
jgi:hypothetical protein